MTEHKHPPHSLLARFSSVCASFDKAGTRVANRLAETSKAFCQLCARRFVEARQHLRIASFYGSDTTPLMTRKRWLAKVCDNLVIRSSRVCNDWLIQRQFLYDSREGQVAILTDPVLLADKTAMSHFAAQRKSFPLIRQFNHTGIILSHHVWDGAVRSACEKACRRYHRAYELHMESTCSAAEARLLTIKSWLTFCTCILHSVQNVKGGASKISSTTRTPLVTIG